MKSLGDADAQRLKLVCELPLLFAAKTQSEHLLTSRSGSECREPSAGAWRPIDEHAVRAAMEMQAAVAKVNEQRRAQGLPYADPGIGIHCGEVVHGFVGTSDRMEFTVIGDFC